MEMNSRILTNLFLYIVLWGCVCLPCKVYAFDTEKLVSTSCNSYYDLYDFLFPVLAAAVFVDSEASSNGKICAAVSFVNFNSNPDLFERVFGLGTNCDWRTNATLLLRSGNLKCSEQSILAAMMLECYYPNIRFRDVTEHTFHEVKVDGRWVIVDPYSDMRILNFENKFTTYDDIQAWIGGDKKRLSLGRKGLMRTKAYLYLFKSEAAEVYDTHYPVKYLDYSFFVGWTMDRFLKAIAKEGLDLSEAKSLAYLGYVRNNVAAYIFTQKDKVQAVYRVQDYFFEKIRQDIKAGIITNKKIDGVYFARGYQLLGRYKKALVKYRELPQSDQICFYMSQCYYKLKDLQAFNALANQLQSNPFYRYMYQSLNGSYLFENDKLFFEHFMHRNIGLPTQCDDYLLDHE